MQISDYEYFISRGNFHYFTYRSIVAAGLIPYYDENPDSGDEVSINNDVGPFLNADVIFKNSDKNVDLKIETSQGVREYEDYPLKLEWTKSLRNMKLDRMIGRLIQSKIICKFEIRIYLYIF